MQRKAIGALAVALALGAGGCGGSDSTVTSASFVKQAEAACVKARAKSEALRPGANGLEGLLEKVTMYQRGKLDGISALTPPAQLETKYAQFKQALAARTAFYDRYLSELRAGHRPADSANVEGVELQKAEEDGAQALHAKKCVENPGH